MTVAANSNITVFSLSQPPAPEAFVDGVVIPIDKPLGWTSADVVRKVKFGLQRKLKSKNLKVGHAGTLDPLATGVLLLCTGKATKQADAFQAEEKEYIAEITIGATTPSFDLEKEIDARYPYAHVTKERIEEVLKTFVGQQEQMPPAFSAKLIDGKRAYEYAREGKDTTLRPAVISIYQAELCSFELPVVTVRLVCSKGTYVRAFARDFGLALESGAHLTGLRRSRSGKFNEQTIIKLLDFEKVLMKM